MTNTLSSPAKGTPQGAQMPNWIPPRVVTYLEHTHNGRAMRDLARQNHGHASTIMRHIRHLECLRDDPLVDEALSELGASFRSAKKSNNRGNSYMIQIPVPHRIANDFEIEKEARRILRRMCETSAFLIIAPLMEKAAVMRQSETGAQVRTAVLDRHIAQAFALKDWIERYRKGKVSCYRITSAGKAALKRLLVQDRQDSRQTAGFSEAMSPFLEQQKEWDSAASSKGVDARRKRLRYNLAESPLTSLGRRKGKNGTPFLSSELVMAGERLREDFEMAQMGPRVTQNWERFMTAGIAGGISAHAPAEGPTAARERVSLALRDLGPGLGDIALRCCCFLEGMETAEKRMGWSARSGKIVLRIALTRLKLHYEHTQGTLSPMIG